MKTINNKKLVEQQLILELHKRELEKTIRQDLQGIKRSLLKPLSAHSIVTAVLKNLLPSATKLFKKDVHRNHQE